MVWIFVIAKLRLGITQWKKKYTKRQVHKSTHNFNKRLEKRKRKEADILRKRLHGGWRQAGEKSRTGRVERSESRKTSVENSSQCSTAESSQPAPQESYLQGSEQVIGMLQPLMLGEEEQEKPCVLR